jgi:predicted porin
MQSSSDYNRFLLGVEGQPWKWLNVRLLGGPDLRSYNSAAPVNDYHPVKYYGEAALTATLTPSQTVTFAYKQWQWVSSTGKIPALDSTYNLNYHWNATKQLGFDLGGRVLNIDYTSGNATTGSAPSLRNDIEYTVSAGVSYAFTKHFSASLAYAYDFGRNLQDNLAANLFANYREFDHQTVSLAAQYKF